MKNSIKRITSSIMAAATLVTAAMSTTASASYIDGDREVDYYDFKIDPEHHFSDDYPEHTVGIRKRIANRNWVVSVNSVNTSMYAITYGVMSFEVPTGAFEQIANETVFRGTGNSGGQYSQNRNYAGYKITMYARQSSNLPSGTILRTSGQWSPDAPY